VSGSLLWSRPLRSNKVVLGDVSPDALAGEIAGRQAGAYPADMLITMPLK
jgi:hypothetical protein